jgi:hypothetical protein
MEGRTFPSLVEASAGMSICDTTKEESERQLSRGDWVVENLRFHCNQNVCATDTNARGSIRLDILSDIQEKILRRSVPVGQENSEQRKADSSPSRDRLHALPPSPHLSHIPGSIEESGLFRKQNHLNRVKDLLCIRQPKHDRQHKTRVKFK